MDRLEREVPEDEPQPALQPLLDPRQHPLRGGAVRALEVAVHDELEISAGLAPRTWSPGPTGSLRSAIEASLGFQAVLDELEFLFVLLVAAAGLVRIADLIRVPYPIVLVLGGLAIGFIPGLPDIELPPDVIFLVFLPPLLVAAGLLRLARRSCGPRRRALAHLSIVLVLATMVRRRGRRARAGGRPAVGGRLRARRGRRARPTPSPRSPPSAGARVPERVQLVAEGEAMINDATALVAFRVALGVATGTTFDAADAALEFVCPAAGGIAIGLAVGWLEVLLVQPAVGPAAARS